MTRFVYGSTPRCFLASICVAALMSADPVSFPVDGPLVDVIDSLMANDFRRVFVHDEHKLVGLISRSDLMPAILDALLDQA